jgi:flavin-dependent dehydrogenase
MTEMQTCDVLVVGGGPAGSTIAAMLAAEGRSVTLVDKDVHPRFHIGESLLPMNMPYFERLGVADQVAAIGMPKHGVEFVSPYHRKTVALQFAQAWDKSQPMAFQVRRSQFDHVLLKNAAAKGAAVIEGCKVSEVDFTSDGVTAHGRTEDGTEHRWQAKFLVDATGRDTLMASRLDCKQRNTRHNSAAIYGHFTGAKRPEGKAEGNIAIFWFDKGWFWFIPLADGTTSIGAVCKPDFLKTRGDRDITEFFHSLIALSPELSERLKDATLTGPATGTGNYSYRADRMTGDRYIMVGDAFAFIDPVFSTGVFLAMRSAFLGAEAVATCLDRPAEAARAQRRFAREVRRGIDTFSWYIYRITRPGIRNLFMNPRNVLRMQEAVLGLLAGDIRRNSPIHPRLKLFKGLYYINTAILKLKGKDAQTAMQVA